MAVQDFSITPLPIESGRQAFEAAFGSATRAAVAPFEIRQKQVQAELANLLLQRAQQESLLGPLQLEVQRRQAEAALELLPHQVEARKKQLQIEAEIAPLQAEAARRKLQAEQAAAGWEAQEWQTWQHLYEAADEPGRALLLDWRRTGLPISLVLDESGNVDADLARAFLAQARQAPVSKELLEQALKVGVNPYTEQGLKPPAQLAREIAAKQQSVQEAEFARQLRPPESTVQEATEELNSLTQLLSLWDAVRGAFINVNQAGQIQSPETRANVVGPLVGSAPGRFFIRLTSPAKAALQARFAQLASEFTAQRTRLLKGALSNKELAFIQQSIPQVTDPEPVWQEFLNRVDPLLRRAQEVARLRVDSLMSWGRIPEFQVVDTLAEAKNLPPGTVFKLSTDAPGVFRLTEAPEETLSYRETLRKLSKPHEKTEEPAPKAPAFSSVRRFSSLRDAFEAAQRGQLTRGEWFAVGEELYRVP